MLRRFHLLILILFSGLLMAGCASEPVDETGFAAEEYPLVVSETGESWITFNGEGNRMVFGRHEEGWDRHTLWESVRGEEWSEPQLMPFSGTWNDRGTRFYPALDAILFSSDRPVSEADTTDDFNIWITQFDGEEWSSPEPMSALNSEANDIHPTIAADGTIWFSSDRDESLGRSDLFYATLGSGGYEVLHAEAPLNSERSEADSFIDPDGRFIIFARTDDPRGLGGDDLFVAFRQGDSWTEPRHLGPKINTPEYEYGPWISGDGGVLYFTSHRGGTADIYRIVTAELPMDAPTE